MNILFLGICAMSLMFFGYFFVECHRETSRRKPRGSSVVRVSPESQVSDSAAGKHYLIHLEKEMADFFGSHQRATPPNSSAFVQQVASRTEVWRPE